MIFKLRLLIIGIILLAPHSYAAEKTSYISIEGALAWQGRNDQRIPGNTGSLFSLSEFDKGPFKTYRVYASKLFNKRHELRVLYAPLEIEVNGEFNSPVTYMGRSFASGVATKAYYKFNSYRLTYAYHLDRIGSWDFALGITGKIRDAEVRLSQGSLTESKKNVGFVPLFNFQARTLLSKKIGFRFDFDGLAAPQGRAFDVGVFLEHKFYKDRLTLFGGYRTVEGGADNDSVYNMAWIHYAALGIKGSF